MPSRRAFESPIAIACFGFFTFLPLRPLFSFPCFISRISVSTFFREEGAYLREELFFDDDFLPDEDFLREDNVLADEDFLAEDFFLLLDFFLAAFVAIRIS